MPEVFFTGCTHFDHANIIRLANRPFADVEEMNETLIERWNAKVGKSNVVYHLGDFGFIKNPDRVVALLSRLNGHVVLVHGNHDPEHVRNLRSAFAGSHNYVETELDGSRLVLFHYPMEEWNGFWRGALHLHCHTHQHDPKGKVPIKNRVNVTVEAWNYTPVSLDEIRVIWPEEPQP